jgi:hypothetical protein
VVVQAGLRASAGTEVLPDVMVVSEADEPSKLPAPPVAPMPPAPLDKGGSTGASADEWHAHAEPRRAEHNAA